MDIDQNNARDVAEKYMNSDFYFSIAEKYKIMEFEADKILEKVTYWQITHMLRVNTYEFAPQVYIRGINGLIGISWDGSEVRTNENGTFEFEYKGGVEYITAKYYQSVVIDFCKHFLTKFRGGYIPFIHEHQECLDELISLKLPEFN